MSEQGLESCMNCGRAFAVIEVYMFDDLRKYAAVCCNCGFRTAIFDKESYARAVWNSMKDRVLAQACEARFANPIENALRAKMRKLEAGRATLQARIEVLEAALVEIRDRSFRCLLPAEEIETEREFFAFSEINEIGMKAESALKGEVKE